MKILKEGKLEERKFTCDKCGCVFIADERDKKDISERWMSDSEYGVYCPTCEQQIEWYKGYKYDEKEDKEYAL